MSPVSFLAVHSKRGSFHTHGSALCISFYLVIPREHPPMLLSFNALSLFSKLSKMSWHGHKHSLLNHSLNDKLIQVFQVFAFLSFAGNVSVKVAGHKSLCLRFLCLWKKFVTVGLLEAHALLKFWYYCQIAFQEFESIHFPIIFFLIFANLMHRKQPLV